MTKARLTPTASYLNECFTVDFEAGTLVWKTRPKSHFTTHRGWVSFESRKPGTTAGSRKRRTGYRQVTVDKASYSEHRLIMTLFLDDEVDVNLEVDHINGVRDDNRIDNLRLVTRRQNMKNKKMYSSNNTGVAGVTRKTNKEGHEYFVSSWENERTGERESVYFSILKLGEVEALSRAVAHRGIKIQHLVSTGEDYTERHGSTT